MCGVAGIVGRLDDRNRRALAAMTGAISHRGPDREGTWESVPDDDGWGCLLGFRRLSILDLSTAADQPMTHPETGQTLVFNGEIYNYRSLRSELAAAGERVTSTGDTEVLLRLLSREGAPACSRLRGMFGLALWDPRDRTLIVARDHHGMKPLYIAVNPNPDGDWAVVFASELRAVLASGLIDRPRLDPRAVESVIWNGFVVGPVTAVEGVELLPPGTVRRFDRRGQVVASDAFWAPATRPGRRTTLAELEEALADAVELHLASDVPLGVFLSGGVDSSAVANLAQRARPDDRIRTFTLAFEEAHRNEGDAAAAIAAAIGTDHQEVLLTERAFLDQLEDAVASLDQPSFDGVNSYVMSRAVREAGLTVALAGTGGDELFGGYESFRAVPTLHRWSTRTAWAPRSLRAAAARAVRRLRGAAPGEGAIPPQTRWAKLPHLVDAGSDLLALYQLTYALFLPELGARLAAADGPLLDSGLPPATAATWRRQIDGLDPLPALSALEARSFLGERLLRDGDATSMAVSLEMRLPLVDHVITDTVAGLDLADRYQPVGDKKALRTAGLRGLDPALFAGPKQGFELPFDRWTRQHLGDAMHDTLTDAAAVAAAGLDPGVVGQLWDAYRAGSPGLYWSRVWSLYVLIHWCQRNGVRA